jgi:hypothetical protein
MFATFEAESQLSLRDTVAALDANTSRAQWFRFPRTPFVGHVWSSGFRVYRVVRGLNSFNPMLYGRLTPSGNGTRVKVILTLHPVIWVFLALWSIFTAYTAVRYHELFGFGFTLFPWVLAVCFFPGASRASKRLLSKSLRLNVNE